MSGTAAVDERGSGLTRAEFRGRLERLLEEIDSDERIGTLMSAAELRLRFHYPDLGLTLNVSASDELGRHLRWRFSDSVRWAPKLRLEMDSDVADRYLRGEESLAVAIARGQVRVSGDPRAILHYLPALHLACEPYRRIAGEGAELATA